MDYIFWLLFLAAWVVASAVSVWMARGVASWVDFLKLSALGGFFGGLLLGFLGVLLSLVAFASFWPEINVELTVNSAIILGCVAGTFGMTYGNRKEWAKA